MRRTDVDLVTHYQNENIKYKSLELSEGVGQIAHVITDKTPSSIGAGFIKLTEASFEWELLYDEVIFIKSGELFIIENENKKYGKQGDVFFLPKGSKVIYGSEQETEIFYALCPANWRE